MSGFVMRTLWVRFVADSRHLQRNVRRIAEPVGVLSIQVICRTPSVSLINMVLVAEVGRNLGSLNGESIAALTSTANQKLLIWVNIELETCKKRPEVGSIINRTNINDVK